MAGSCALSSRVQPLRQGLFPGPLASSLYLSPSTPTGPQTFHLWELSCVKEGTTGWDAAGEEHCGAPDED